MSTRLFSGEGIGTGFPVARRGFDNWHGAALELHWQCCNSTHALSGPFRKGVPHVRVFSVLGFLGLRHASKKYLRILLFLREKMVKSWQKSCDKNAWIMIFLTTSHICWKNTLYMRFYLGFKEWLSTIRRNWAVLTLHIVQTWWFLRSQPKCLWKVQKNAVSGNQRNTPFGCTGVTGIASTVRQLHPFLNSFHLSIKCML